MTTEEQHHTLYLVDWDKLHAAIELRQPVMAAITILGVQGGMLIYKCGEFVKEFEEIKGSKLLSDAPFRLRFKFDDEEAMEVEFNCYVERRETDEEMTARQASEAESSEEKARFMASIREGISSGTGLGGMLAVILNGPRDDEEDPPKVLH